MSTKFSKVASKKKEENYNISKRHLILQQNPNKKCNRLIFSYEFNKVYKVIILKKNLLNIALNYFLGCLWSEA